MKVAVVFCFALVFIMQSGFGDDAPVAEPQEEARRMIEAAAQTYVAAFNSKDAEKLSQLWSEKAVYTLPETGEQFVGRAAIRKMFADLFSEKDAKNLAITVDSIRFITDNVAVETGTARLIDSDGTVSLTKYSAINVKQNEQWLLDSVNDSEVLGDSSKANPLSELEWMVGQWVDASDESQIETTCQWTKNRKFLTRNFVVAAPGSDELEGTQVIGWDPISASVRSWVFDSDGGFSEGTWTKKGKSWVVESKGFTNDGQSVASIQVFSSPDADSFQWQSFGRYVDNEQLPDIAEVKIIRKK